MIELLARGPAVLFCPADRPELLSKALERADAVVMDLEDAVAADRKSHARETARQVLRDFPSSHLAVRVNAPATPWFADDVDALAEFGSIPLVIPMAESASQLGRALDHALIPLIETPRGVAAAAELADASPTVALMWGSEDLAVALHSRASRPHGSLTPVMQAARSAVLLAAAAAGKPVIDAVLPDFRPMARELVIAEGREAADMGFDAKACIHPAQVAWIRESFRASDEDLERASQIVSAAERHSGAFSLDGEMIDAPIISHARRILALSGLA
ncbi:HpcH/HpaI aldolase/citrate lyase family protein [Agrococcus baldri]|uniref:Citrate lyase subunit beta-like protein n=1 Tax=Agrococcus baldri TaxID=153730 RepID=A0AA87REJ4_9MICO|nr:CoA ester lyase [Agrococcus baldri]GEK79136.1 citrate lyase subunit beta-like protein [Agrococcus baldri]